MNENIMLSFLELASSNFVFPVFRKSYDTDEMKGEFFKYYLPTIDGQDKEAYAVSFTERPECVQYYAKSTDNINMTKKWLAELLIRKAQEVLPSTAFFAGTYKVPNISFIISSHKEGESLIQVEPYYLEVTNSFGFLLDYKFKPFHGYEKSLRRRFSVYH